VIVLVITGLPAVLVNTTVAVRAVVVGFGSAVTITTPPLLPPPVELTDNHEAAAHVPPTLQDVFANTFTPNWPPAIAEGAHVAAEGESVSVGTTPA